MVVGTIVQEFWRGASIRRKNTGTDVFTSLVGLVGRNKRRYGGYIVHVGIVMICFGFAGNSRKLDEQVLLKPGQEATIGRYTLRSNGVKVYDDGQKQMTTGYLAVFVDGKEIDGLYPAKWAYRRHEGEPTTEVAIRRSFSEDLYLVLGAYDVKEQSASLEMTVNPLVDWVWVGFGVLAIGTGIALLPEQAFSFAMARLPAEAVTSTMLLLSLLLTPGVIQWDFSITKTTRIREGHSFEFRFEAFDFPNHPNYNPPSADIQSSTFGRITSARTMREMQFGFKYVF